MRIYGNSSNNISNAMIGVQGNLSAEDSDFPDEALQGSESILEGGDDSGVVTSEDGFAGDMDQSADSDSSEEPEIANSFPATEFTGENDCDLPSRENSSPFETKSRLNLLKDEGFVTWQRIMCVDAVRANGEWIMYSPSQAAVSEMKARRLAESVGLQDHDHLEPSRIFHAARLVTILEAYALYDPEIGYCQGMSDLLSPIIAVMEEDFSAFWWFCGLHEESSA
ncbi:hypothetical protein OIU77_026920 [Salix suchowensis]|uniref:Rab-GAP TBC domain-containing protein n=1 Tax=Salix suchowensis TaxID=1278906 RepID=A0ABQ9BRZ2_9ROSI|nr:hypothetical protein OIU77_026920 [Salix suchowensis]